MDLVESKKNDIISLIRSIELINIDEFDTYHVKCEDLKTKKDVDVYITSKQWRGFNCQEYCFIGNIVTFTLEERKVGVTGYKKNKHDTMLVPHKNEKLNFVDVMHFSILELISLCEIQGFSPERILLLVDILERKRREKEQKKFILK